MAAAKVQEAETVKVRPHSNQWSKSLLVEPNTLNAHLVFAVAGNWNGLSFIDRLPFFSKLTLRLAIQSLEGYNIIFESIKIDEI